MLCCQFDFVVVCCHMLQSLGITTDTRLVLTTAVLSCCRCTTVTVLLYAVTLCFSSTIIGSVKTEDPPIERGGRRQQGRKERKRKGQIGLSSVRRCHFLV